MGSDAETKQTERAGRQERSFAPVVEAILSADGPVELMETLARPAGELVRAFATTTHVVEQGSTTEHAWSVSERIEGYFDTALGDAVFEAMGEAESVVHRFRARSSSGEQIAVVAVPLIGPSGIVRGALGAVVEADGVDAVLDQLEAVVRTAELSPVWSPRVEEPELVENAPEVAAARRLARYDSPTALAFAITNGLANRLECELVALAVQAGPRLKLLSISGQEVVRSSSPAVARILGAMEESVDLDRPTRLPAAEGETEHERPLVLASWLEDVGGSVAAVPVRGREGQLAVLALRRAPGVPIAAPDLDVARELVEPYVPGIDLLRRARRGILPHVRESSREQFDQLRTNRVRGGLAAVAALFALWFLFGSMAYSVHAPATVQADQVRQVAAPFDGRLLLAPVVAGDRVREGDLLAEFDASFQRLELAQVESQLAGLSVDLAAAMAAGDGFEQRRLEVEQEGLQARAQQFRTAIASARIVAPFDGVVLAGDVRDRVGDTLNRGEPLIEVAPPTGLWLEVEVPESDALSIVDGASGSFAARARPENRIPLTVQHIGAAFDRGETGSVLRVTADLERTETWMRPGMGGTARLSGGRRAPWRQLFGPLVDRLHLRFGR